LKGDEKGRGQPRDYVFQKKTSEEKETPRREASEPERHLIQGWLEGIA
jgi:hypothetical protein